MSGSNKNKKQNQKIQFSRKSILLSTLFLTSVGYMSYLGHSKSASPDILSTSTRKMVYPIQYSDAHITQNAIDSNPKFSSIAFVETENILANAVSSVDTSSQASVNGMEVGTWLWTPILDQTAKYRSSILSGAAKNGIKNIYLSVDSYLDIYIMPDSEEKTLKRKLFDQNVESFIREANEKGITVDAEAGWRNWAEDGNAYKAYATINYANRFNRTHSVKFRAFQYDVEPYLLEAYQDKKDVVLKNFLKLIDDSVTFLNKSDLQISVVIPEFYDGTNGDTPRFMYKGKNGYAVDHLLSILDRRAGSKVIVMSYRNFSKGTDGSIDISTNEIDSANKHSTKVIVAQETGDVEPSYITFHNTNKKYFSRQKTELEKAFSMNSSYGGIAIHYINAFMDLK